MSQQRTITRRSLLRSIGYGGAAALSFALWPRLPRQTLPDNPVSASRLLMGGVTTVAVVSTDVEGARAAIAAAFETMQRRVRQFNRYDPTSPLAALNSQGHLRAASGELVALLRQAHAISLASHGAFDVTILPLVNLYRHAGSLPARDAVRTALQGVGYQRLFIDGDGVALEGRGMGVTLDGIAKGAVVDAGLATLRQHGFDNCLVEAGGDLAAHGSGPAGRPWRVGLRPPRAEGAAILPRFMIGDRAVATSGDYLNAFSADFSIHHIIDPRRGVSPAELASVTVFAPSAAHADALATTLMVTGLRNGLTLLERYPECDALFIDKHMQTVTTPGLTGRQI